MVSFNTETALGTLLTSEHMVTARQRGPFKFLRDLRQAHGWALTRNAAGILYMS
jgi:hypothetical protein